MRASAVRCEEIRVLFGQGGPVLWANLTVGTLLVGALSTEAPSVELLGWLTALVALSAVRASFHRRFHATQPGDAEIEAWGRRFVLGSASAGVLWGAASLLFFSSSNLLSQTLLTFAIGGMTAAAAGTLACHLPAFYAFFGLSLAPLLVRTFIEGDRLHLGMGAILLVYGVMLPRVVRNNHFAFERAFRLSLENALLLERVSLSQVDLQETNHTLEQRVLERTRELEQQAQALQRAQRLEVAGRLAGGLAHDFNSLLTVITNNAALLKETQPLDEHGRLAADETLQAGQRGVALIRHLLAFSRNKHAEPRVFALNPLIDEWSTLLKHILGEGFSTAVELTREPTLVYADPAQVEQVLVNLVANSRTGHSCGGRLRLTTRVSSAPNEASGEPERYVQLVVEHADLDTDADVKRPLNPYLSFDPDSRNLSRGMASVWSMAEQWGGRISLDHEGRDCVRFVVHLPAASPALSLLPSSREAERPAPQNATILVVDDEPTLRSVIRRCLTREGYNVLVAEDGEHGLKLANGYAESIHLLLTDVVMPGLTGLELAQKLQPARPDMAVLFISGFTFEEAVPPSDPSRGTAYLPKPFDTKTLTAKVSELLFATRAASGGCA